MKYRFDSNSYHAIHAIAKAMDDRPRKDIIKESSQPWKDGVRYFVSVETSDSEDYISGLMAGIVHAFHTAVTHYHEV